MTNLVKIDGEEVQLDEFIRVLKLTGQFQELLEQFVRDRLAAPWRAKAGILVTEEEIQERADQYRRVRGLHRAVDTNKFFDALRVSLEEFEGFITDSLYQEKMMSKVCGEQPVEGYFKLNSPSLTASSEPHRPRFGGQGSRDDRCPAG